MNNKGFTLIELILTIALLAIIAIISFVSINGVLEQSKVNDCENLVKNIKSATKEYFSDNRYSLDDIEDYKLSDRKYRISAYNLINENYLSSPIYDPFDSSVTLNDQEIYVYVELDDDYTVDNNEDSIVVTYLDENKIDCNSGEW